MALPSVAAARPARGPLGFGAWPYLPEALPVLLDLSRANEIAEHAFELGLFAGAKPTPLKKLADPQRPVGRPEDAQNFSALDAHGLPRRPNTSGGRPDVDREPAGLRHLRWVERLGEEEVHIERAGISRGEEKLARRVSAGGRLEVRLAQAHPLGGGRFDRPDVPGALREPNREALVHHHVDAHWLTSEPRHLGHLHVVSGDRPRLLRTNLEAFEVELSAPARRLLDHAGHEKRVPHVLAQALGAFSFDQKRHLLSGADAGHRKKEIVSGHLERAPEAREPHQPGPHTTRAQLLDLSRGQEPELLLLWLGRGLIVLGLLGGPLAHVHRAAVIARLPDEPADGDFVIGVRGQHFLVPPLEKELELALVAAGDMQIREAVLNRQLSFEAPLPVHAATGAGREELLQLTFVEGIS